MSKTLVVEKLGAVSLRHGIVYVQLMASGADSTEKEAAELAIPLPLYGQIAAGFQNAGTNLQERLKELQEKESQKKEADQKETKEDKIVN